MSNETIEELRQKAKKALSQGQYEQACQCYLEALALESDQPELHYGLGTVYFLMGDLPQAALHFKEVIRLDPARAGGYVNLGAVYNRMGQFDDAMAVLRKGIQIDPARGEGYYNLGLVYKNKGLLDMAIQAYREATRVSPNMADAHYNLGNIYCEKGNLAGAIAHYEHALSLRPQWEKARIALDRVRAHQLGAEGPPSDASAVRAAMQLDPDRLVDPNTHGNILRELHHIIIEIDGPARKLDEVLVRDVEQGIRDLSNCLLFPSNPAHNLAEQLRKFELLLGQLQKLQSSLKKRLAKVDELGDKLLDM